MTVKEVANELISLCASGKHHEAMERLYDENIVSTEPMGAMQEARGMEAVKAKAAWWDSTFDVKSWQVEGPYLNGDQFAVRHILDITEKSSGKDNHIEEVALYTVENGKITAERFFYDMPG